MRRICCVVAVFLLAAALCTPAFAQSPVAVTAKVGTLGGQIDLTGNFSPYLKGRVSFSGLPVDYDFSVDDVNYDFNIHLYTVGLLLDLHPFANGFRISAGAMFNSSDFTGDAKLDPNAEYEIGDVKYKGSDVGRIDADVDFNKVAPYTGLGYSNAFTDDGHWSFAFDAGVMWWGSPDVTLSSPNSGGVPGLTDALQRESQRVEDEIDQFKWYPVVSVGVGYSF